MMAFDFVGTWHAANCILKLLLLFFFVLFCFSKYLQNSKIVSFLHKHHPIISSLVLFFSPLFSKLRLILISTFT